eukprot:CAMPEP_0197863988 /NCGR_PEP_ID=MMETSP1438-20131217/41828_1 /TAXON_ID=1461541 /ORGANISM="Pterosperma sp., Strain CCMP1384" /LENGTH=130 /DNA_ID=CAMNT_0043482059 /DNA_START=156 /DNA_END=544 /DNA_ORIENTATION=-
MGNNYSSFPPNVVAIQTRGSGCNCYTPISPQFHDPRLIGPYVTPEEFAAKTSEFNRQILANSFTAPKFAAPLVGTFIIGALLYIVTMGTVYKAPSMVCDEARGKCSQLAWTDDRKPNPWQDNCCNNWCCP